MSGDLRDTAQYFCIEMARRGYLGSTKKDDFAAKCHSEALVSMTGALDSQLGKLYENIAFMQPNATQSSNGDGFFDAKITVSNKVTFYAWNCLYFIVDYRKESLPPFPREGAKRVSYLTQETSVLSNPLCQRKTVSTLLFLW